MKRFKHVKTLMFHLKGNCTSFSFRFDKSFSFIYEKEAALGFNEPFLLMSHKRSLNKATRYSVSKL